MTGSEVSRPRRKTDYVLYFLTREADKGWRDLVLLATLVNPHHSSPGHPNETLKNHR